MEGDLGLLVPTGGGFRRGRLDGRGGIVLEPIAGLAASDADYVYLINP